jgi:uncharacterized protein (DUF1697 family)
MNTYVVLLRAIGPWTHKIMSMKQWKDGVVAAGFIEPETYIATGNMIVQSPLGAAHVTQLMNELVTGMGLNDTNTAVVRTPGQMSALVAADPFPEASRERPSQMGVFFFTEARPKFDWVKDYAGPEQVTVCANHLIIDYMGGVAKSKLTPRVERLCGIGTGRNWNSLRILAERSSARATA